MSAYEPTSPNPQPEDAARILLHAIGKGSEENSFLPILAGFRSVFAQLGIHADRIQLPMTRQGGFRHPTLSIVVLTWCHDREYDESFSVGHGDRVTEDAPPRSIYSYILQKDLQHLRIDLTQAPAPFDFPLLVELRNRGYRDYVVTQLPLPSGRVQMLSLATLQSFPANVIERLNAIRATLGLSVYAAYRTSQAIRLAAAYIGPHSGRRVLAGEIRRGSTRRLTAGIMFCDIQGFTAMSMHTPPETVVHTVNQIFEMIEVEASRRQGEILKFIGDAVLIIFPAERCTPSEVAQAIVETTRHCLDRLAELDGALGLRTGATIGEVVQGNVGTPERLDFTVMGSAVNLASRLESLCRPLEADALFCKKIAALVPNLQPFGTHQLKGFTDPVEVFGLPKPSAVAATP
ncbi:MAG: hypothetical protein CL927_10580 [Deltaproteobacteria bacterium]|nr:hypothetical protein [Deltaproteobacteria bacterium]HCH62700.1 hypothetical protein [Deltaproteobacteria bacterium]